jgi:hypothetical protein
MTLEIQEVWDSHKNVALLVLVGKAFLSGSSATLQWGKMLNYNFLKS